VRTSLLLLDKHWGVRAIYLAIDLVCSTRHALVICHSLRIYVIKEVYLVLRELMGCIFATDKVSNFGKVRGKHGAIGPSGRILFLFFNGARSWLNHHGVVDGSIVLIVVPLHEAHRLGCRGENRNVVHILSVIDHRLVLCKIYNILLVQTVIWRLNLFFRFLSLLIRGDAMLLAHDDALATTREIDDWNIIIGAILMLALAVGAYARIEFSTFWISKMSLIRVVLDLMGHTHKSGLSPVVSSWPVQILHLLARVDVVRGRYLPLAPVRKLLVVAMQSYIFVDVIS
jgi:hypothetical protein